MKKNILNSIMVICLLTVVTACKTKKAIVNVPPPVTVKPPADNKKTENFRLLMDKDVPYNTLSMKGKVGLDIDGNVNNVKVNIRMKKDEKIWVSITAIAGIEVARALITPDSVLVRNNLQSVGVKKPFSYLNRYTSKQVTFKMLQAVLSGNTISEFLTEQAVLELSNGVFVLSGSRGDLSYRSTFNSLFKTAEINMNDPKAAQALKVVYSDYQKLTDVLIPSALSINALSGKKKTNISFDFATIERNVPLDFPFSVPNRFEIIN
jgi:hypothetical protein